MASLPAGGAVICAISVAGTCGCVPPACPSFPMLEPWESLLLGQCVEDTLDSLGNRLQYLLLVCFIRTFVTYVYLLLLNCGYTVCSNSCVVVLDPTNVEQPRRLYECLRGKTRTGCVRV